MIGIVDDFGRPLIRVAVKHPLSEDRVEVGALIDTVFSRELMLNEEFSCRVEWFGEVRTLDAFLCSGLVALIGVGLLEDLVLHIDYPARTVQLALSPSR